MPRAFACALGALLLSVVLAPSAVAHSAFLGSTPEPGARLGESPRVVLLTFTEPLNERLSRAVVVRVADGREVVGVVGAVSGKRLVLRLTRPLGRGAYRVRWHTASTDDGHALEGTFSFGVRAAAAAAGHDVEEGPLARQGWLRVLARGAMYMTLLVFCGALMLDALLSRRGVTWLAPQTLSPAVRKGDRELVVTRHQRLLFDLGLAAAGAAALSAVADATDAAGGFSARGVADFLVFGSAGLTRLSVVVFLLVAWALAALRLRAAAVAALGALWTVAFSGHANAASPRGLAVTNDWLHLTATALWLGGIALIVALWGPLLRFNAQASRLAVMRHVLPTFGRVALPAFAVVVVTGLVSAVIELGRLSALFGTGYGRVLLVKVDLVAFIAAASYMHALRLRPRLLRANPHPDEHLERRHWRLLRAEPLLGVGVVAAVALLVAFPLPPRQLNAADGASAAPTAPCSPCPLPRPTRGELAVAEQGGSDVVAVWVRREGAGMTGTVRLYGLDDRPARDAFTVLGARQTACGVGCARFRLPVAPAVLSVGVRQKGRVHVARVPVRWRAGSERRARRLLERAQRAMRALDTVREFERVSSVPGVYAITNYRLKAPNRMAYRTEGDVQSIVLGATQWTRGQTSVPWRKGEFGGGLPFRTRSWFTWTTYARHAFLLGERIRNARRVAVVALMDPATPAWWRVSIDLRTHRVLQDRLVTYGHFMTQRFTAFNRPLRIEPPGRNSRGG